jgi:tRNA (guanine37-N1)-methyltransferase
MVQPLRDAIAAARVRLGENTHTVCLSPQGRRVDQATIAELAGRERLILVCGRYEGIDERLLEQEVDEELSVGDFVASGGEVPAMLLVEAMTRLLPGALGHEESASHDSFADGLLDCPHYTRPEVSDGLRVPTVLLSGDHEAIRRWRLKQALGRTWQRRPDLLRDARLDEEQRALLDEFKIEQRETQD